MQEAQHNVDHCLGDLVAHFKASDQNTANIARTEILQTFADLRLLYKPYGARRQRLNGVRRSPFTALRKIWMEPHQLR